MLAWCFAVFALFFFGWDHLKQLVALALLFLIMGFVLGPFLEPPADPLGHLRRVYELSCDKTVAQMPRDNRGVWQYSMIGTLICPDDAPLQPEKVLRKIDLANGLLWALLASTLYILAIQSGLAGRWAFFSVLICFLFFGTNRFNYFRYYSLGPGFTSMMIYWLWVAAFFFKKKFRDVMGGLAAALLLFPILWINHRQEAVFLGFTVLVWLLINGAFTWGAKPLFQNNGKRRPKRGKERLYTVNHAGFVALFIVCWLLPQFDFFRQWLSQFFIRDMGEQYRALSVSWHGLYLGGYIAGHRIPETLGGPGLIMVLLFVPYFRSGFLHGAFEGKVRIFILALLPFIVYLVPLFHFVWSSNIFGFEYYRLCYMSMFWLLFADVAARFEQRLCPPGHGVHYLRKNDKT